MRSPAFAGTMIEDHNKASDELKTLIRNGSAKETLPSALDDAHQKKLDELKALSGAEFARTYVDDQVSAHKDAVSLFERYAKGGDNVEFESVGFEDAADAETSSRRWPRR